MNLKHTISEDMKAAMRSKESAKLGVIRLMLAAIKQREIDERIDLDDAQITVMLDKMLKQTLESKSQFLSADRDDLVRKCDFEINLLRQYLPEPLSEAEIDNFIADAIAAKSATTIKDMGAVMGYLKPKIQGRADMKLVSQKIKSKFAN